MDDPVANIVCRDINTLLCDNEFIKGYEVFMPELPKYYNGGYKRQ